MTDQAMLLGQILARLDHMEKRQDETAAERDRRLDAIEKRLASIEATENEKKGRDKILYLLGAAIIAAAGGTGAFVAKTLGWLATK